VATGRIRIVLKRLRGLPEEAIQCNSRVGQRQTAHRHAPSPTLRTPVGGRGTVGQRLVSKYRVHLQSRLLASWGYATPVSVQITGKRAAQGYSPCSLWDSGSAPDGCGLESAYRRDSCYLLHVSLTIFRLATSRSAYSALLAAFSTCPSFFSSAFSSAFDSCLVEPVTVTLWPRC